MGRLGPTFSFDRLRPYFHQDADLPLLHPALFSSSGGQGGAIEHIIAERPCTSRRQHKVKYLVRRVRYGPSMTLGVNTPGLLRSLGASQSTRGRLGTLQSLALLSVIGQHTIAIAPERR